MVDPTAGIGSVADWVAAGGTLAAFGIALVIWRHDIEMKKRELADKFLLLVRYPPYSADFADVVIDYTNAGDVPIYTPRFHLYNHDGGERISFDTQNFDELGGQVDARQSGRVTYRNVGDLAHYRLFVEFKDGNGKSWYKTPDLVERTQMNYVHEKIPRAFTRDITLRRQGGAPFTQLQAKYKAWSRRPFRWFKW